MQQVPEVLNVNKLCTNLHHLQQFLFCVSKACATDVCGDIKSPSSRDYANRQFLEKRKEDLKHIHTGKSTVTRTPRPQVILAIFRAGQMETVSRPASI